MNKIQDLIYVLGTSLLFLIVYWVGVKIEKIYRKREGKKSEKKGQKKRKNKGA
jgi:hypothetical protein